MIDNALDHNFDSIHIIYDGINGQLPNLDLFNTAVSIANGQMGINIALQRMWKHEDSYLERLQTMLRGMVSQGVGQSSGPHSSFIPYHVDAITLQAVGNGPQDEMAMGRVVESIFRSLNNLLEHFHQSFFFYLLMQADRFVSIGTYLPSAMLVAVNFTVMAIALWIRSGRPTLPRLASTMPENDRKAKTEIVQKDGMTAVAPKESLTLIERELLVPITFITAAHFTGLLPLYIFNRCSGYVSPPFWVSSRQRLLSCTQVLSSQFLIGFTLLSFGLPAAIAARIRNHLTEQHRLLIQCFSLLLLGMFLATLATLNFSLSLFVGLLSTPLSFANPSLSEFEGSGDQNPWIKKGFSTVTLQILSPPVVLWVVSWATGAGVADILAEASFGWNVNGMRTQVVIWCVWWPAWLTGSILASP